MKTTTESQIQGAVAQFLQENFLYMRPDLVLQPDDRLLARGVIDSMGIMELIAWITDTYGVELADEEITEANLGSLAAIAQFVAGKLGRQGAAA